MQAFSHRAKDESCYLISSNLTWANLLPTYLGKQLKYCVVNLFKITFLAFSQNIYNIYKLLSRRAIWRSQNSTLFTIKNVFKFIDNLVKKKYNMMYVSQSLKLLSWIALSFAQRCPGQR